MNTKKALSLVFPPLPLTECGQEGLYRSGSLQSSRVYPVFSLVLLCGGHACPECRGQCLSFQVDLMSELSS